MKSLSEQQIMNELKAIAPKTGVTINDLRVILALERVVARIEAEPRLANHLIFKGGFVLFKSIDTTRYTRDVDALANDIAQTDVASLMISALYRDLSDCCWFRDAQEEPLPNQGPYGGLRINVAFHIANHPPSVTQIKKLSRIHIDIGFGDSIQVPKQKSIMYSILSKIDPVSWFVYPLESVFAEKLEALLRRGSANSRAKDIHDLVLLFDRCQDASALKTAIEATFKNRKMSLPKSFSQTVEAFDTEILKRSWNSIVIMGAKETFEATRTALLQRLKKLDDLQNQS